MRDKIYATFTKGNKSFDTPLWELMSSEESYHDEGAWELLGDILGDGEVAVFFEYRLDREMLLVEDGHALTAILGETTGFIFYVTDRACSYLVAFNDHDVLMTCGAPAEALHRILSS